MAVNNLQSTLELNDAIAKQAKLLARSTKELKDQLAITQAMAGLKSGQDQEQIVEHIKKMNQAIREASTSSEELGTGLESIFERIANGAGKIVKDGKGISKWLEMTHKRMPKMTIIALGFFSGFAKGMKNIANLGKGAVTVIAGMASSIFELSKAIISIPFKILGGLVEMANSMPGGTAFAQAREDIRKEFGTFEQDVSANIKASFKSLRGELAETGLSVYRVLGNMAERLKYVHELATGMGTMFHIFGMEVAANAEAMIAYQKGLGISAEQMKTVGLAAVTAGRSMTDVLNEITIASTGMADAFGMSHKVISRDMADMMADVTHFTSITAHEMAKASVYVRKLGMEIKDLVSMIDKYDNFEDAAVGAAHLAQAFGANVDALEMMKEQDPSKRLDMLRKSMAMAGVDAAKLTRQELKLLAQQTGLSEEAAKAAFSLKNQGTSMADLEKQQARNQKKTMTQEEAMSKLSNSIERMVKSGQRSGGFFTQFFKGFESGIKWSREFWGLMRNIRHSLRVVYWAGRQVGRLFVEHFPGVKQMISALREFFHPGRFRDLMKKIKSIFGDFFKMMSTDPTTALPKLLEKLKTTFFDFFSSGSPAGSKFLGGLQKFGSAIGHILGSLVRIGLEKLRDFFTFLAAVIKDPGKISGAVNAAKAGGKAGGSAMLKMFAPILDAVIAVGPSLLDAFVSMTQIAWQKIKAAITKFAKAHWKEFAIAMLGPAAIKGAIAAVAGAAVAALTSGIGNIVGGMFKQGGASMAEVQKAKITTKMLTPRDIVMFGAKMAALATAIAIGGVAMAIAMVGIAEITSGMSNTAMMKSGMIMAGTALVVAGLSPAAVLLSKIPVTAMLKGFGTLAIVAPIMALGAAAAIWALQLVDVPDPDKLRVAGEAMSGIFFTVAAMLPIAGLLAAALLNPLVAVFLGAGAVLLGAFATVMVGAALPAIEILVAASNKIKNPAKFKMAGDILLGVLNAMNGFASNMSAMVDAVKPKWYHFDKDAMKNNMKALTEFTTAMMGNQGMLGALNKVQEFIAKLSSAGLSENQTAYVKVIGDIFSMLTGVAQALQPPPGLFEATSGLKGLISGDDLGDALNSYSVYIDRLTKSLVSSGTGSILNRIVVFLDGIAGKQIDPNAIQLAQGIGTFLGFIGPLVKSLTPPDSFFEGASSRRLQDSTNVNEALNSYTSYMTSSLPAVAQLIEASAAPLAAVAASISSSVISSLKGIDPIQLQAATTAFSTILGPMFGLIGSLMTMAQDVAKEANTAIGGDMFGNLKKHFGKMPDETSATSMTKTFEELGIVVTMLAHGMTGSLRSLATVAADIGGTYNPEALKIGMELLSASMGAIIGLIDIVKNFTTLESDIKKTTGNVSASPGESFNTIFDTIIKMIGGQDSKFRSLGQALINMPMFDKTSTKKLNSNVKIMESITKAVSGMTSMMSGIKSYAADGSAVGASDPVTIITQMVTSANEINAAMANLTIDAAVPKLKNLANALGVKQKKFTIKNDRVRIDMSLTVNLETESLAYAIWDGKYFDLRAGEKGYPKKRV